MPIIREKRLTASKTANNSPFRRKRTTTRQIPRILAKIDKIGQLYPETDALTRHRYLKRHERRVYLQLLDFQRQQQASVSGGHAA